MKRFADKIRRFVVSEDGPTAVEYAVMLALIIVVCLAAITTVGESANDTFQNVANQLSTTSGGSGQ
ncbi:MAG: Flp family type IVb pilin [Planctomycetaceae bacterium]|mgnify:FL=1|nr:Flp family type IVb pilin [Planctomycetaceae bacterium]